MTTTPTSDALDELAATLAPLLPAPVSSDTPTYHVGVDDLPYAEAGDGSAMQLLHVDLNQGLWISRSRIPPGFRVIKHFHTGFVYAVTIQGRWWYEETPEQVNKPGSYLFEPAGSVHTLTVPADQDGDTIAWFAIQGANVNLDDDGNIASVYDARFALTAYRGYCDALGLDYDALIVVGE